MKKILLIFVLILFSKFLFGQGTLLIYGGKNHEVYLGCLNCDNVGSNSIWNEVGTYGSKVSSKSIWNEVGTYGSKVSDFSPWNEVASYPPIVSDKEGKFYGYLTLNQAQSNRAEFKLALTLYKYYDLITEDVGKWYNKIFL